MSLLSLKSLDDDEDENEDEDDERKSKTEWFMVIGGRLEKRIGALD